MRFFKTLTLVLMLSPLAATAQAPDRHIVVSGQGSASAVPDMATIQLGVQRESDEAAAAMTAASEAMTEVLARLAAQGVAPEDIQTTRIGLDPRWQHSNDGMAPRVTGYVASNDLSVTVRDLEMLGGLLDAVVADGANTMNGLTFGISDTAALEDEARRAAVADAAAKAGTLAEAAGLTLGGVVSISEGIPSGGPMPLMEPMMMERAAVPVAAGEVDVSVSVRVVYDLGD